jgi:hypothetical protein
MVTHTNTNRAREQDAVFFFFDARLVVSFCM